MEYLGVSYNIKPNQPFTFEVKGNGSPVVISVTELPRQSPCDDTADIVDALYKAYLAKLPEGST